MVLVQDSSNNVKLHVCRNATFTGSTINLCNEKFQYVLKVPSILNLLWYPDTARQLITAVHLLNFFRRQNISVKPTV